MKHSLLALPLLVAAGHSLAEPIQYQASLGTSYFDSSEQYSGQTIDYTTWNFGANITRFFSALETEGAVQQELAFVRRASSVSFSGNYHRSEFEQSGVVDISDTYTDNAFSVAGQYFVNENTYIRGHLIDLTDADEDGIGLGAGYYYGDTSAVQLDINGLDNTSFVISNHTLVALNESSSLYYSLGLGAAVDAVSDTAYLHAGTTYYLTNYTGFGISGSYAIEEEEFGYRLFASHYFNDRLGVEGWLDDPDEEPLHIGMSVVGRF